MLSETAVRQIWKKGPENKEKGNVGRKTKWTDQLVTAIVESVDWENRSTFAALSHASGISKKTLYNKVKGGLLNSLGTGTSYKTHTVF